MNALESTLRHNRKPATGDFFTEHSDEIHKAVDEVVEPVVKHLNGNALVKALHIMDDTIQKHAKFTDHIQCDKQECSFCCHSEIFITKLEADYIKSTGKYVIDQQRLEKQRKATSYNDLSFADKACIMLKDGKCQVYNSRPVLCRNHAATIGTNPEECHQQNIKQGTVFVNEPRTILTEALQFYIPYKRIESLTDIKNIADFEW